MPLDSLEDKELLIDLKNQFKNLAKVMDAHVSDNKIAMQDHAKRIHALELAQAKNSGSNNIIAFIAITIVNLLIQLALKHFGS